MALAQRMHASGESANTIAATLGVNRATVYRVLLTMTAKNFSDAPLTPACSTKTSTRLRTV
jgi:DNA-binding IclR family transcriptional regulator